MGKKVRYYTAYLRSSERVLGFGVSRDCAKMLGITLGSFYCAVDRSRRGEASKYDFAVELVDEEELNDARQIEFAEKIKRRGA